VPAAASHVVAFDPATDRWRDVKARVTSLYFRAALDAAKGNRARAAEMAGIARQSLHDILKKVQTGQPEDDD
jgi:DNA-binding NtrC family response regulator